MLNEVHDFGYAFSRVRRFLEEQYNVLTIEFHPAGDATFHGFSDDRIADFNPTLGREGGRNIKLRSDVSDEFKLFSLLHLFGHILQFNGSKADAELALSTAVLRSLTDEELVAAKDYEKRASQYGVAVLRACDLAELVPWLSAFWAADWRFLEDVYRGRKLEVPNASANIRALLQERKDEYTKQPAELLEPIGLPSAMADNPSHAPQGFQIL